MGPGAEAARQGALASSSCRPGLGSEGKIKSASRPTAAAGATAATGRVAPTCSVQLQVCAQAAAAKPQKPSPYVPPRSSRARAATFLDSVTLREVPRSVFSDDIQKPIEFAGIEGSRMWRASHPAHARVVVHCSHPPLPLNMPTAGAEPPQ